MRRGGCLGLLIALAAIAALFWVAQSWKGRGPLNHAVDVTVPQGSTLTGTADRLQKAGAIRSAWQFRALAKVFGTAAPIQAGQYRINPHSSPAKILAMLQSGKTMLRLVTIPEGMPSVMVRDRLVATKELTGPVTVPAEGSVLPDSYSYDAGNTRQQILTRMQNAMARYLDQDWARRDPALVVTTPRQALILASIVEKETALEGERRTIAAVYANRLKRGMPLQADPTVIYPITKGRPLGRRILESELHAKNGYNTYAESGLPIGPICNPGRASIDAVLHPAQSNALYFVADGSGGHVFADTLEQHNANVRKWYAIRHARGEM